MDLSKIDGQVIHSFCRAITLQVTGWKAANWSPLPHLRYSTLSNRGGVHQGTVMYLVFYHLLPSGDREKSHQEAVGVGLGLGLPNYQKSPSVVAAPGRNF